MTFSDPIGRPVPPPAKPRLADYVRAADADLDLPPLPTLEPLPTLRPMPPMPRPPWELDADATPAAAATRPAPPPPAGHPAAGPERRDAIDDPRTARQEPPDSPPMTTFAPPAASTDREGSPRSPQLALSPPPPLQPSPLPTVQPSPQASAAWPVSWDVRSTAALGAPFVEPLAEPIEATGSTPQVIENPTVPDVLATSEPSDVAPTTLIGAGEGLAHGTVYEGGVGGALVGRHSVADPAGSDAAPPRLRVVLIGGAEPLGSMVAQRLIAAGHRLAVHDVRLPAGDPDLGGAATARSVDRTAAPAAAVIPSVSPISLPGDRSDTDEVVHTVARAEVTLGGLDAIVVLPARHRPSTTLEADATAWADTWSAALTTEVLAAACAAHIAARSFLARRRAGRIVLVADGRDGASTGAMPASAIRAAISSLGTDLARELGPHGIGVSVVTTGAGGSRDFALAQVADVVEALLSTPVLSGVSSRIG